MATLASSTGEHPALPPACHAVRFRKRIDNDKLFAQCRIRAERAVIVGIEVEEQQLKALIADDVVRLVQRLSK
jgi:hypothetical protein